MERELKERYMKRAIEIAKTAIGHTSPNPIVGCVIVKDKRIISEACHERYGEFHAERNALTRCKEDTTGASAFVTLEPCCHHGKTPPCTDILIEKGISKVYIGSMDPNPLVAGNGVKILKNAGIEVEIGILKDECDEMNEIFFHFIEHNTPFIAAKYAMTLDGKICTKSGDSKWITGEKAREHVHFLRKKYSAIMVGIGTVISDNPMLNCRTEEGVNPIRIICDSCLSIPIDCDIVKTSKEIRTIVAYCEDANIDKNKKELLDNIGVEFIAVSSKDGKINLRELVEKLGDMKIDSVLVEGGSKIHGSFLKEGLINKVYCYIAPKIVGGVAKSPISGEGIELMKDAVSLNNVRTYSFGNDFMIEGSPAINNTIL